MTQLSAPANAFIGNAKPPSGAELRKALGPAHTLWTRMLTELKAEGISGQEWGSSSKKLGWSLRVKCQDRIIVYLGPFTGFFRASFALGDKAVLAARKSDLPSPVIKMLDEAKRYAEGTPLRLDVKTARDLAIVKTVAKIKLAN